MFGTVSSDGQCCRAGLTVEDDLCKYLLLENNSGYLRVSCVVSEAVGTGEDFTYEKIFRLLSARDVPKDVPVAFALRFNESLIKIIDMPGCSPAEARSAIECQFEDYFPFPCQESRFAVGEVQPGLEAGEKRFVAAASRARVIDGIRSGAAKHGFILSAAVPSQIAFEQAVTPPRGIEKLLEIYAGKKELLFILSNSCDGILYRNIATKAAGVEYIGKTADEARAFLEFANSRMSGFEAERIIIAGPNAGAELCAAVSLSVGQPRAETVDPFAGCAVAGGAFSPAEMILPLGAALGSI